MRTERLTNVGQLPERATVCIYGAGGRGERVYRAVRKYRPDVTVAFFADSFKQGSFCDLPLVQSFDPDAVDLVIVASFHSYQICRSIELMGVRHCLVASHLFSTKVLFDSLDEVKNRNYHDLMAALTRDEDREFLEALTGIMTVAPDVGRAERAIYDKYSQSGPNYCRHVRPQGVRHVYDIGAGDGVNSLVFLHRFPEAEVYGFEPEEENYTRGDYYEYLSNHPRFQFLDKCFWSSERELCFSPSFDSGNQQTFGRVADDGARRIAASTVDAFTRARGLEGGLFIKAMVNGFEMEVLRGAVWTLRHLRPQVSVYARNAGACERAPFATPAWCVRNMPGYEFFFEHYTREERGTVFTCVPKA